MSDLSSWLNDEQTRAALGVSPRTLDRMAKDLRPQRRPVPGRKPERVFDPEVIYQKAPAPPVSVAMQTVAPMSPPTHPLAELAGLPDITWPAIIDMIDHVLQMKTPPSPAMWIRLNEASQLTGLSRTMLRRLIASGDLKAVKDQAIKVRREGLDSIDVSGVLMGGKPKGKGRK
jgi:hypothetical protein